MQYTCQFCGEAMDIPVARTGGIFRCPGCMHLNLLLEQGPEGLLSFDRFDVIEEVGQGANAVVCKARERDTANIFALKLFLSDERTEEHAIQEFIRESGVTQQIVHKNICRLYECGELHHIPYLLLEFVDGLNLAQYLEAYGRMDQYEAFSLGCYVCAGLDYVWSNFLMIHRDIKPQNIMLDRGGNCKTCDFGMVTSHEMAGVDLSAVEGTPFYLSPESITEDAYQDNRSDIYSLGATLYHVISGVPPFDYGEVMKVVEARLSEDPPDIRKVFPEASDDVANVLRTMMARSPDDRYVTARECLEDLHRVAKRQKPRLVDPSRERTNK